MRFLNVIVIIFFSGVNPVKIVVGMTSFLLNLFLFVLIFIAVSPHLAAILDI